MVVSQRMTISVYKTEEHNKPNDQRLTANDFTDLLRTFRI